MPLRRLFPRRTNSRRIYLASPDCAVGAMRLGEGRKVEGKDNEMNDSTNPLECALNKYVNFSKGCYIGQEVIARLDTYDKISKHLIGLKFEENVTKKDNDDIKILTGENECGYVTSTANSERFGSIGLGFIKTPFLDHDKEYFVKFKEKLIKMTICKLQFK